MAFATGHTARTGFTAGQLKDGDSFGTIDAPNYGGGAQPSKFKIDLRYYKNTLITIGSRLKTDGTVVEQPAIVTADWINSIKQIIQPTSIPALNGLASLAPTTAKLTALGLQPAGLVPVNPTGDVIPFEQTADGIVQAYVSPADQVKQQQQQQQVQQNLLTQLTNQVTGNGTSAGTGTGTGMSTTVKIVIGVVVVAVVGGIIFMATRKKKGGKK